MITPEFDPAPLALWLIFVDGTEREILRIDREVLNLALDEMKKSGAPIAAVISKAIFSHFLVPIFGRMKAVLRSDHGETLCGVLNYPSKRVNDCQ